MYNSTTASVCKRRNCSVRARSNCFYPSTGTGWEGGEGAVAQPAWAWMVMWCEFSRLCEADRRRGVTRSLCPLYGLCFFTVQDWPVSIKCSSFQFVYVCPQFLCLMSSTLFYPFRWVRYGNCWNCVIFYFSRTESWLTDCYEQESVYKHISDTEIDCWY